MNIHYHKSNIRNEIEKVSRTETRQVNFIEVTEEEFIDLCTDVCISRPFSDTLVVAGITVKIEK